MLDLLFYVFISSNHPSFSRSLFNDENDDGWWTWCQPIWCWAVIRLVFHERRDKGHHASRISLSHDWQHPCAHVLIVAQDLWCCRVIETTSQPYPHHQYLICSYMWWGGCQEMNKIKSCSSPGTQQNLFKVPWAKEKTKRSYRNMPDEYKTFSWTSGHILAIC